ncbi:hypothetical protein F4055_14155 [Candidatus Poribacteria bacterium]|nr:hypothetical protein [Candidatus Poribacteria bacterium]
MNQENDHNVSQMRERYLWGADAESRLKEGIQKIETDLKEDIQRVEADLKDRIQKVEADLKEDIQKIEENFMNAIQEVKENHKRLVSRILWVGGLIFAGAVTIVAALISKG